MGLLQSSCCSNQVVGFSYAYHTVTQYVLLRGVGSVTGRDGCHALLRQDTPLHRSAHPRGSCRHILQTASAAQDSASARTCTTGTDSCAWRQPQCQPSPDAHAAPRAPSTRKPDAEPTDVLQTLVAVPAALPAAATPGPPAVAALPARVFLLLNRWAVAHPF